MAAHPICRQSPKVGAVCVSAHVRICAGGAGQPASLPQKHAARPADTAAAPKTDPDAGHHAASTPESQSCASGRAISAGVRRQVWQRDGGRCSYVDPQTGRRCNSTHLIEIDHIVPHALGGGADPGNLRL